MSATILIVEDEELARDNIADFLKSRGYEVIDVPTLAGARDCIQRGAADIILLDVQLPDGYGPSLLEELAYMQFPPPVIIITAYGEIDMAVEAIKNGAIDFLQKPIQFGRLEESIQKASEKVAVQRELDHLRHAQHKNLDIIVGKSKIMRDLYSYAQRVAATSVSVLITGETGSGKEVLARAIHRMGPRSEKSFMDINCPGMQVTMLESELFGHEAGAFTHAEKRKLGLMEIADGGILFLDEIASMPLDMQTKVLRAIEERSFRRVGGTTKINVDVQIIAASNRNLPAMIESGEFREDLYYRLKVVDIHIPPLRKHKEDIPEFVGYFLRKTNPHMGKNVTDITPRAMQALTDYDWPGNVRQLSNAIEHAVLFCDEAAIDLAHLPPEIVQ